ncbi:hypothetical protein EKO27_g9111 [Xylaria grammica]|uniref:DNL-type domain-containing protein n=1 Tax=Xylaria grammica TaxID=363999 RepID=A0A439CVB8_9PEZI|nr:hypothetical protein EKO27_g9111 [Xylaria grammica]
MASKTASRCLTAVFRTPPTISPSLLRPYPRLPRTLQPITHRFAHTIPKPTIPAPDDASSFADATKPRKQLEPHYQLTFTCVPCTNRSTHVVSKQGYHKGSVLITCPSCRNRHVISDNLNIFGDRKITVEELLREKGQLVKRGTLGEEGDIEFWEDNSTASSEVADREQDEARRLRETRDPSSQATDPTPSVSVLPGDTGTRPSVQGAPHQGRTPSTRRQYHTKEFKPPINLTDNGQQPVDRTKIPQDSEPLRPAFELRKIPHDKSYRPGIQPFKRLRPSEIEGSETMQSREQEEIGGMEELEKKANPLGLPFSEIKRTDRREARKDEDREKPPIPVRERPRASVKYSQQFGYIRPSFLPPISADKWEP